MKQLKIKTQFNKEPRQELKKVGINVKHDAEIAELLIEAPK